VEIVIRDGIRHGMVVIVIVVALRGRREVDVILAGGTVVGGGVVPGDGAGGDG